MRTIETETNKLEQLSISLNKAVAARRAHKQQHAKWNELGLSCNPDDNCCFNHDEEVMEIQAQISEVEEWLDQEERGPEEQEPDHWEQDDC